MNIQLYNTIRRHCLPSLRKVVWANDVQETDSDELIVDEFIGDDRNLTYQVMKVFFVFEKGGGRLIRNGLPISCDDLIAEINDPRFLLITRYWRNSTHNGDDILFSLNQIEVPDRIPTYQTMQITESGSYVILKFENGRTFIDDDGFYTEEEARRIAAKKNESLRE